MITLIFSKVANQTFKLDKNRLEFQNIVNNKLIEAKLNPIYSQIFCDESKFYYYSNTLIVFKNYVPDLDNLSDTLSANLKKNDELGYYIKFFKGNNVLIKSNLSKEIIEIFEKNFYINLDIFESDYNYYTDKEDDVLELDIYQRKSERVRKKFSMEI